MVNRYGYSLEHHIALTIQSNTMACYSNSHQTPEYLLEKSYIRVSYMFVPRIPKDGRAEGGSTLRPHSLGASLVQGLGALKATASSRFYSAKLQT